MLINQTVMYYRVTGEARMMELGESGTVAEDFCGVQFATDHTGKGSKFGRLLCVLLSAGPRWNLWSDDPYKEELPAAFRIYQVLSTTRSGQITADGVESPDVLSVRFLIDIAISAGDTTQTPQDAPGRTEAAIGGASA